MLSKSFKWVNSERQEVLVFPSCHLRGIINLSTLN
nr:MAG TPA: hypothetical protein [Caudoviricetes sp.]